MTFHLLKKRSPSPGKMALRLVPGPKESLAVSWVDQATGKVRIPQPEKVQHKSLSPDFSACGKSYRSLAELTQKTLDQRRHVYRDVHDQYVVDIRERYPCFDWADRATENRYYHWYLVLGADQLAIVYYDDGTGEMTITDDADALPKKVWDPMLRFYDVLRVKEYELCL